MEVTTPKILTDTHVMTDFCCGNSVLDDWLMRRALKNQALNASRTFVTCESGTRNVVGYYSLASGSVTHHAVPRGLRQNMPEPIPVILLGRLAVDQRYQGQDMGKWLLNDAVNRVINVAEQIGVKAMMVHAINEDARRFYKHFGFVHSVIAEDTLFWRL